MLKPPKLFTNVGGLQPMARLKRMSYADIFIPIFEFS